MDEDDNSDIDNKNNVDIDEQASNKNENEKKELSPTESVKNLTNKSIPPSEHDDQNDDEQEVNDTFDTFSVNQTV